MISGLEKIMISTKGDGHVIDITEQVTGIVAGSGIGEGLVLVFVPGSTGAVTTIEYEDGLVHDMKDAMERLFPRDADYLHDQKWNDGNGHSHVRASFIGPSLTVPVSGGRPMLGTWQQIIFMDLDTRSRRRELLVRVMGE